MKRTFNITTSKDELDFFEDSSDFCELLHGFDGVELMYFDEDERHIIPKETVVGLHMSCIPYWLDFWLGDEEAVLREFGDLKTAEAYYGGLDRDALLRRYSLDLEHARAYGAEYVVFHVADASVEESFTAKYRHTSQQVIEASADIINRLLPSDDPTAPLLLMENLWQPGLTFTDPALTRSLLGAVRSPRKGLMLDTGHLMNTNLSLRTDDEALDYIRAQLDAHGDICEYIKGVHLNESLSGAYAKAVIDNPPDLLGTYEQRSYEMFVHVFKKDLHQPFTAPGVKELLSRIAPSYVTFEFITSSNEERKSFNSMQLKALGL